MLRRDYVSGMPRVAVPTAAPLIPAHPTLPEELDPEYETDREQETLDEQILSGLVCPV